MTSPEPLYPHTPSGIPTDLARPGLRYRLQVVLVLATLFLFLLVYLAFLIGTAYLLFLVIVPPDVVADNFQKTGQLGPQIFFGAVRLSLFFALVIFAAFLLKGLFRRLPEPDYLEVTEEEQPELFAFIRALCQEIRCPMPARVFLNHEVNAFVFSSTSAWHLLVAPPRWLVLGLGLVRNLNLVEFKALLAHEFGHLSQRSLHLSSYAVLAHRIIHDLVYARDEWDDWVVRGFDTPWLSVFAVPLYALVEGTRKVLDWLFRGVNFAHRALRWQMEFNADLIAVSVTGSDAPLHLLFKSDFGQTVQQQATQDLTLAVRQGVFTRDLFYHQGPAAEYLRGNAGNPNLGCLPADGVPFFPLEDDPAAKWADHPPNHQREENIKCRYFPSPGDERSAWELFRDRENVATEVTRDFYEIDLGVEAPETLQAPEQVEEFLTEERAAVTFDPRYHGVYDNRNLELLDLEELVREAGAWNARPLGEVLTAVRALHDGDLPTWVAGYSRRRQDWDLLHGLVNGPARPRGEEFEFRGQRHPVAKAAQLLEGLEAEMNADRQYLEKLDQATFTLHHALAERLGKQQELRERYTFQLRLQWLGRGIWQQQCQAEGVLRFLSEQREYPWGDLNWGVETMCQAEEQVRALLGEAETLLIPPLKNLAAGTPVRSLLPPAPTFPRVDLGKTNLNLAWIVTFCQQTAALLGALGRLQAKSLGGILALQEDLVREAEIQVSEGQKTSAVREG